MSLNLPPVPKKDKSLTKPKPLYTKETFQQDFNKGNKVFGIAGASLTWGINGVKGASSMIGINGENETAELLKQLTEEINGIYIFNSIMWPNSKGDTDHVLVYKNRVIIIDSKRWKSVRKYAISASGFVLRGTVPFPEGKVKMLHALNKWRAALPNFKISGIVCIAQEKVFVTRDRNWYRAPYRLVEKEKLKEFILSELNPEKHSQEPDNYALLAYLASLVVKPRNLRSEIINPNGLER